MGILAELLERRDAIPGIGVVARGIVKENWNEDFLGKVKVELILGEEGKSVLGWVPVMSPYIGDGFGLVALPEIGTEVLVAFDMGDFQCPIIIGSLWNNKNKRPEHAANEKNSLKLFRTKSGCEIKFCDEEKKTGIHITTAEGLCISMDDETKGIQIKDKEGENEITLDSEKGAVHISAKNKLELRVGGKTALTLDGDSKTVKIESDQIGLEASQTLKLKGQNTGMEGGMTSIKGQSSLKLESGGMAEVKGAMVKIN